MKDLGRFLLWAGSTTLTLATGYCVYQHGNAIKNSSESEIELKIGNQFFKSTCKKLNS